MQLRCLYLAITSHVNFKLRLKIGSLERDFHCLRVALRGLVVRAIENNARLEHMTAHREPSTATPSDTDPEKSLVRRFSNRYLLVLVAVAFLVVIDQAVIQPLLLR
jgi:hypothetical protein